MGLKRKPLQGVANIVRFNWHFYLLAFLASVSLLLLHDQFPQSLQPVLTIGTAIAIAVMAISLAVSFYIYDVSDLYQLQWMEPVNHTKLLNIHAGFDETSEIIADKFPRGDLTICDFYQADKHTEISIRRARKAYPPDPKTISVLTDRLPFSNHTFDTSLVVFSAHEIRDDSERVRFFRELNRVTDGPIFVTEHVRDFANFMAYTLGAFHFHSRQTWLQTFRQADLTVVREIKTTPFVTTFVLEKHGSTR